MKFDSRPASLLALAALLAAAPPSSAAHHQVPVMRVEVTQTVAAPPSAVWSYMTTGKNFATWCPAWKSPTNIAIMITRPGDVLDFTDESGTGGRSVVTFVEKERELRVVHEPNDGSYMCEAKVRLVAAGHGTTITWIEQYTDDRPAADQEVTAKQVEDQIQASLVALGSGAASARSGR